MQRPRHRTDRSRQAGRDVGAGRGDHAGGEGGGVHAVLGSRRPVSIDGLDMRRIWLASPPPHEALGDVHGAVDLGLGNHRQADSARGLGDVRQHHHRGPREVFTRLVVVDVVELSHPPCGSDHRDRALHVDPDVTGVHRDRERLGRREPRLVAAVDQQSPDAAERHPADELFDVDPAIAQRRSLPCRVRRSGCRMRRHLRGPPESPPCQPLCRRTCALIGRVTSRSGPIVVSTASRRAARTEHDRACVRAVPARTPSCAAGPGSRTSVAGRGTSSMPSNRSDTLAYDAVSTSRLETTDDCGDAQAPSCDPRGRLAKYSSASSSRHDARGALDPHLALEWVPREEQRTCRIGR